MSADEQQPKAPTAHGRRAIRAHNSTAAFCWGTAKVFSLILAAALLGVSLAMVMAEWMKHGEWRVTGYAGAVAFWALFCCAVATVAHAMRVHAIDGPPASAAYSSPAPLPSILEAARAQDFCPQCESTDRARALVDEFGYPCEDPAGWHSPGAVEDDVREDALQHADEDDPFGVIGGAP